jgi:tRNA(fMet)-specific endonuclease VapC
MFLLDKSIVSDLVRNPGGRAAARLAEVGDGDIATSVIVAGELGYGCLKKGSARLSERVEAVLREISIPHLRPEDSAHYGEIRRDLEARGMPIGQNDFWIAAQARSAGVLLVTDNDGEFRRVQGLKPTGAGGTGRAKRKGGPKPAFPTRCPACADQNDMPMPKSATM